MRQKDLLTQDDLRKTPLLVKAGFASALCINGIADTSAQRPLTFRAEKDASKTRWNLVWEKGRALSKAAEIFLDEMRRGE